MGAKKKAAGKPSAATLKYVVTASRTMLERGSTASRDEGGKTIFSDDGTDVCSLEITDTIVVEFVAPKVTEGFVKFDPISYEKVDGKPGWLRYRRPVSRDPGPDLRAGIGGMLGRARVERRGR